ncbi:galactose-1-phosphate uridyl transferase [Epichloe bromicola]
MVPKRLKDIAHRRFDPLRGSWVLLASPHKYNRPRQGEQNAVTLRRKQAYDPESASSSSRSTAAEPLPATASALLVAEPVVGRCYVLTYSAKHHYTVSDMTAREVLDIVEAWTRVYAMHLSPTSPMRTKGARGENHGPSFQDVGPLDMTSLRYMQVFDNNGEIVGCSNAHPHGQIWITSSMPDGPALELAQMSKYRKGHCGRHLLTDYARLEMDRRERVVWQNDAFLAVCPWWAVWPYDILLLPKRQVRGLVDLTETERFQFAEAILQVTRIYDNLFEMTFPYISALHQAPLNATQEELDSSHLHMHFSPPLLLPAIKKFFGGYELYAEPTREITPEVAASNLRRAGNQLSDVSSNGKAAEVSSQGGLVLEGSQESISCRRDGSSWWRRLTGISRRLRVAA